MLFRNICKFGSCNFEKIYGKGDWLFVKVFVRDDFGVFFENEWVICCSIYFDF